MSILPILTKRTHVLPVKPNKSYWSREDLIEVEDEPEEDELEEETCIPKRILLRNQPIRRKMR